MSAFDDELQANARYAESFGHAGVPSPAARGLAVVTCMDSRIDPLAVLGLQVGDAKVLRNPGGQVTEDVLVALVLAVHLLAVRRVLVLQHTDCRMAKVTEEEGRQALREATGQDTSGLQLRTIADQPAAVRADVARVRSSPYLPDDVVVAGGLYDVATGRVELLVEEGGQA